MTVTNVTPPVITGTARQGQTLQTSQGTWTHDLDFLTYEYQWRRCDAAGANCVDIAGAVAPTYLLVGVDVGSRIRSRVTATEQDAPPPAVGAELTWSPPSLTAPTTVNLSNSARSVPRGSGGDLIINCTQVLNGAVGEIHTYSDVVAIEGEFLSTQSRGSSGHIVPRQITGTFHLEGWKYDTALEADFCTSRERVKFIQIQACDVSVTDANTSYHADFFQTQITNIDELRIDSCTVRTDYQGVVLINELPIPSSPNPAFVGRTIIRRTVFRFGNHGRGMWFFLSKPPKSGAAELGPIEMYDVWAEDGGIVYPSPDFRLWTGVAGRLGSFVTTKLHWNGNTYPFIKFSTPADTVPTGSFAGQSCFDCNVRGDGGIWLFPNGGNPPVIPGLGAPADAGMGYVSPGYV